jgi:type I restriction enzyme, S subunit
MREFASELMRVPLGQLAEVDPEVLPENTNPRFAFKYVDIASVSTGRIDLLPQTNAFAEAPSRARMKLRSGDVLMSTVRPNLKAFAQCRFDDENLVASTGFAVIRAKGNADSYFLLCSILSSNVSAQIERVAVGSNYPAINVRDVQRLLLPKFTLKEQRGIGAAVRSIDNAIQATEALIDKHQQIKAGLMHDLFTRGVFPNGELRPSRSAAPQLYQEQEGTWFPMGWQFERLDSLALRGSGHTPNKEVPEYWNGGIKWVSLADSHRLDALYISDTEMTISHRGIQNSSAVLHPAGIVVLSRDAGVGKSAITTQPMAVSQHFMCWKCDQRLDNHFLYYWLQFQKRTFENIAMGSTILTIGLPYFKKLRLACPVDLHEQRLIANRLRSADENMFALQRSLSKLRAQKLGLMQDLLTGKVRVPLQSPEVTT